MTSERRMLIGEGGKGDKALGIRMKKRRRWVRRILIGGVVLVIVLVAGVWFGGPAIAARVIEGKRSIPLAGGQGRLIIDDVSLRWGGPQRVGTLRIEDPDGAVLADLRVISSASLLGAPLSKDVGRITLSGRIDLSDQQIAAVTRASGPGNQPAPTLASTAPGLRLPRGWTGSLQTRDLEVNVRTTDAATGATVDRPIQGLAVSAEYAGGESVVLSATSESPKFDIHVEAHQLVDSDGVVHLDTARGEARITGVAPHWLVDALAQLASGPPAAPDSSRSAAGDDAVFDVKLSLHDGRLQLTSSDDPALISIPLASALAASLAGGPRQLTWLERPGVRLRVEKLDIPLGRGGSFNWKNAGIGAVLDISVASVSVIIDPEAGPERVDLEPTTISIASDDLSKGLMVTAQTRIGVRDREPAQFSFSVNTGSLVDAGGELIRTIPAGLEGQFQFAGIPVGLFEGLAEEQGLTLEDWLGGSASGRLTVRTRQREGASAPGDLVAAIEFEGGTPFLSSWIVGEVDQKSVRMEGSGIRVEAENIGPLLRVLAAGQPVGIQGSGMAIVDISDVEIPLVGGLPDLGRTSLRARLDVGNLVLTTGGQGDGQPPVTIRSIDTEVQLASDQPPRVTIDWRVESGADQLRVAGSVALDHLVKPDRSLGWPWLALTPDEAVAQGSVRITGLTPVASQSLSAEAGAVVSRVAGDDLALELTLPASGEGWGRDVGLTGASSAGLSLSSSAGYDTGTGDLRVEATRLVADISGSVMDTVSNVLSLRDDAGPRLGGFGTIELEIDPIDIQPESGAISEITARLGLPEGMVLRRALTTSAGEVRDAAVRGIEVQARINLASTQLASAKVTGELATQAGRRGSALAMFSSSLRLERSRDGTITPVIDDARVSIPNVESLDHWLGMNGALAQSLGGATTLSVTPEEFDSGIPTRLRAELVSANSNGSATLVLDERRIALAEPARATVSVSPALAAQLMGWAADGPALLEPVDLVLEAQEGSIGRGDAPLAPEVFALNIRVSAPTIAISTRAGDTVTLHDLGISVSTGQAPGAIAVDASVRASQSTDTDTPDAATAQLEITGLADAQGRLTPAKAHVSGTINGTLATDLLDSVMASEGLAVDLLGPTVKIEVQASDLGADSGGAKVRAVTEYAQVQVEARPRQGTLYTQGQTIATIKRITPELSERVLTKAMPLVKNVQKTVEDRPAVIRADALTVPMDSDLTKLNGDVNADLGTIRFETSGILSNLLKTTHNRPTGQLGKRVEPFDLTIRKGVVTYQDIELPIGDFAVTTRGTVDLVEQQLDLVVFVPLFALADDVVKGIGGVPGLNRLAMIPFRVRGPMDDPNVAFAPDLLGEGLVPDLLQNAAEQIGGEAGEAVKGIGRALKGLGKKPKPPK